MMCTSQFTAHVGVQGICTTLHLKFHRKFVNILHKCFKRTVAQHMTYTIHNVTNTATENLNIHPVTVMKVWCQISTPVAIQMHSFVGRSTAIAGPIGKIFCLRPQDSYMYM